MNQLYFHSYEELISMVRERQHDMMNHIDALYGMAYSADDFEELVKKQKEYCNFIVARNKESKLLLTIENPLIAGFLYKKKQQAEMEGIEFHHKVIFPKNGSTVPEYELIEISGILLDNAIEACEGQEQKEIFLELNADNKILHLSVSNSSRYFTMAELQLFFQQGYSCKGKMRGDSGTQKDKRYDCKKKFRKHTAKAIIETKQDKLAYIIKYGGKRISDQAEFIIGKAICCFCFAKQQIHTLYFSLYAEDRYIVLQI